MSFLLLLVYSGGFDGMLTMKYVYSVEEIAKKKGVSMAQIAVAWILSKDRQFTPLLF